MRKYGAVLMACISVLWLPGVCFGDDAQVLPKGVARAKLEGQFYLPVDTKYDKDGNVVSVAKDYNRTLDNTVFPLPPGTNLGRSVVNIEYEFTDVKFNFDYGLTDRLTVGFMLPYSWARSNVSSSIDSTNANLWISNTTGLPVPANSPGSHPATAADIKKLLTQVYGYKNFETWSDQGVGDVEVRFRYQYYKSINWRLAFTGGLQLPTGQVDDPDNLVDYPLGLGYTGLLFRLNTDYIGINNLVLNATIMYNCNLPYHAVKRVPPDPHTPITANKENVSTNPGDVLELDVSASYELSKGFYVTGQYRVGGKQKDKVSGSMGFNYSSLEEETNWTEQVYNVGLSYSTIPLYMEKKFSVPMSFSISYRDRFKGSNNALDSQYIETTASIFF